MRILWDFPKTCKLPISIKCRICANSWFIIAASVSSDSRRSIKSTQRFACRLDDISMFLRYFNVKLDKVQKASRYLLLRKISFSLFAALWSWIQKNKNDGWRKTMEKVMSMRQNVDVYHLWSSEKLPFLLGGCFSIFLSVCFRPHFAERAAKRKNKGRRNFRSLLWWMFPFKKKLRTCVGVRFPYGEE